MKPHRIVLSRKKGFKLPPNSVSVARPTKWGNPFKVGKEYNVWQSVDAFENLLETGGLGFLNVENIRRELRGKNLACWCPLDQLCHADVLLRLANAEVSHSEPERKH